MTVRERLGDRLRSDDGVLGGSDALVFGVLLFVVCSLVIANAWGVADAKFATSAAAREAARAYVEAPDAGTAAARAHHAAALAMAGHGRDAAGMSFDPPLSSLPFERCARVVVGVRQSVPVIPLPWVRSRAGSYTVTSRYSEIVDPYRSGLDVDPDEGVTCATAYELD